MESQHSCAVCGASLEARALPGLCPACLWHSLSSIGDGPGDSGATLCPAGQMSPFHIPGHEVLGEIARGGMGIVYRARELHPDREVALKMLLPFQAASSGMRERFRHEVRAAASFDHPNILPVYRTGEHDGLPFFTMKLAKGGNLAERTHLYRGRYHAIASLISTVAGAVQSAHERGVLHRDLKPGNILFDETGHPFVADFGLAKLTHDDLDQTPDLTRSAALLGTPRYMPPEVALRGVKESSTCGDIYSLGAILYELLTGQTPFRGTDTGALLLAITRDAIPWPRAIQAEIPRDLETICLKCIEREPHRRYTSAAALADDLRRFIRREPIHARPVGWLERGWMWCCRHPVHSALTGVASLLAVTLLVGLWRFEAERTRATQNEAAMTLFQESLADNATDPAVQNQHGLLLERIGRLREAEAAFTEAIRLASEPVRIWSFDGADAGANWKPLDHLTNVELVEGTLRFDITGNDPSLGLSIPTVEGSVNRWLHVRLRNGTSGDHATVYWGTQTNPKTSEARKVIFPIRPNDRDFTTYSVDLGSHSEWVNQKIVTLRLDPAEGDSIAAGRVEIDWICLFARPEPPNRFSGVLAEIADPNQRSIALLNRARIHDLLNQPERAEADFADAKGFPRRDPKARRELISLTRHYNLTLAESLDVGRGAPGKELNGLASGIGRFGGTDFDVRGILELASTTAPAFPETATNISVGLKFSKLHVLMGVGWDIATGGTVGEFVLRYDDGHSERLPIQYGVHVKDWVNNPGDSDDPIEHAEVVWTGQNQFAQFYKGHTRLYKSTWTNPRPGHEVRSLDFVSAMTDCAPFLVAITVEP